MFKSALFATSALLFACNAQEIPTTCTCTQQYDPVCCSTLTGNIEYSNTCTAECAGLEPDSDCASGTCSSTVDCFADCATADSDPYCCNFLLYDNACLASCDDFTVATDCDAGDCPLKQLGEDCGPAFSPPTYTMGECEPGLFCEMNPSIPDLAGECVENATVACTCPADYDPVCCLGETFSNECTAVCANGLGNFFDLDTDCTSGVCSNVTTSCICPTDYSPVCCITSAGSLQYSNLCGAACDGLGESECFDGECSDTDTDTDGGCICTMEYDPVCCGDEQFSNLCGAACDGFAESECTSGECEEDGCVCTEQYEPVCCDGMTFGNACSASCEGGIEDADAQCYDGECEEDGCVCIEIYEPFCCEDSEQFSNECFAACEGYNVTASCVQDECLVGISGGDMCTMSVAVLMASWAVALV